MEGRGGGSELFVFRSTIVSYCPSPSAFLLPLFRACSFRREGTRTSFSRRVDGFRSISRVVAKSRLRWEWPANRKKTVAWKGTRFVKSYRLIRSVCRVPKANRRSSAELICVIVVFSRTERKDGYARCFFERDLVAKIFLLNYFWVYFI